MSMKKVCVLLLVALSLCACTDAPIETLSETSTASSISAQEVSEETEISCTHMFGDEPVEIVGNLYVFECTLCGAREVVPQGTLIGN